MIDVIIPAIKSDLGMLGKCIEGLRRFVSDGVNNIYLVAPKDEEIKAFCNANRLVYVDEKEFMGFSKDDFSIGNDKRNGWLYQQLIKLNSDKLATTDNFLVFDADHVLIQPHTFFDGKNYHFYVSEEFHEPYFNAIGKLFGGKYHKLIDKSFISDKMMFNKEILANMKKEIEEINNEPWIDAIIKSYDQESFCGFSEFETYGTYFISNRPHPCIIHLDKRHMCMFKIIDKMSVDVMRDVYRRFMSITKYKEAK